MSHVRYLIFGDLHGRILPAFCLAARWEREHGVRLDGLLQVGDLGYFPDVARLDRATARQAADDPMELGTCLVVEPNREADEVFHGEAGPPPTLWFTAGNHEDFDALAGRERDGGRGSESFAVDAYGFVRCIRDGRVETLPGPMRVGAVWGIDDRAPRARRKTREQGRIRDSSLTAPDRLGVRHPDLARRPEGCGPGGQRQRGARCPDRSGPAVVRLLRALRPQLWPGRGDDRAHAGLPPGRVRAAAGRLLCRGGQRRAPDLGRRRRGPSRTWTIPGCAASPAATGGTPESFLHWPPHALVGFALGSLLQRSSGPPRPFPSRPTGECGDGDVPVPPGWGHRKCHGCGVTSLPASPTGSGPCPKLAG